MRPCSLLLALGYLAACGAGASDADQVDVAPTGCDVVDETSLVLRPDLCDDPVDLGPLVESITEGGGGLGGNPEQIERMLAAPTEGPFYMVNLIRYRDWAVYPDGRQTDLTGREANALYSPLEFLQAIGARVVYSAEVDEQIAGEDVLWEDVAIVEYPCPVAFFAMIADEAFQERAIHKEAGVETTLVMVTELLSQPAPEDPTQTDSPYAPTSEDQAFDLVQALGFHELAQYEPGSDEPERTGQQAWTLYAAAEGEAAATIGAYDVARFDVEGMFIGDEGAFDEIRVVRMPSRAGMQVWLDDETRRAAQHHRQAALADEYGLVAVPMLSRVPNEE